MKKGLALFLAFGILLLLGGIALSDETPETHTSGDWVYVVQEDGTACIADWTGKENALVVPETLDGMTVTKIGDNVFMGSGDFLTSITIPNSVTSIGDEAFKFCRFLTSITIPNSVTSIGVDAFKFCGSLTSITIPNSVTSVDATQFYFCNQLQQVIISPEHPTLAAIDGVLFNKTNKQLVLYPLAKTATSYTIPQGIESIGNDAFYGCNALTSITIPDSVTSIGDSAFSGCESLTSITIPDSVTSIWDHAFYGCYALTSITIPNSVTSIGSDAFSHCYALTSITIPDSVTSIGTNPFCKCYRLQQVTVSPEHSTLTIIDGVLFDKNNKQLVCYPIAATATSYTIPQGIVNIGDSAFYDCDALTSITIPDSVTSIGNDAFYDCNSLTSITIPDSVTSIGDYAFSRCDSLTSITIPDSVTSIGDSVFDSYITLTVSRDSHAEQYAKDRGIAYIYPDTYDWLNN